MSAATRLARLVALLGLVAGGLSVYAAPAFAAGYCSGSTGVSVAVDYGALGGGVVKGCVTNGAGRSAWSVTQAAGHALTAVQKYPGAVCRIDGKGNSSCYNMPPADAYWGLFKSTDGGSWAYAQKGAKEMTAGNGDTIGWSWQASTSQRRPGTAPARPDSGTATRSPSGHATSPKRSASQRSPATRSSSGTRRSGSTSAGGAGGSHPARRSGGTHTGLHPTSARAQGAAHGGHRTAARHQASTKAGVKAHTKKAARKAKRPASGRRRNPHQLPTPSLSVEAKSTPKAGTASSYRDSADHGGGGLPWWLPVGLVVLLGGTGTAVALKRRGLG